MDGGLSLVALALSAIGTVGSVVSGISQARAQSAAAKEQARIYDEQAVLFEEQAKITEQQTAQEREALQRRNRQVISRNRVVAAAAGVDPFEGSPIEMELANLFTAGLNEASVQRSGDLQAFQSRLGARSARQQAGFSRRQAGFANGQIPGVVFSGLAQGGSVLGNWYRQSKYPTGQTTRIPRANNLGAFDNPYEMGLP